MCQVYGLLIFFLLYNCYDLSLYYCFHPFSIVTSHSIFLGDFGDENVEVVQNVANIEFAKAVILGNHDAWFTKQFSRR